VYFTVDGGKPFIQPEDSVIWGLGKGAHTVTAYIGDADGRPLAGTSNATANVWINI
jgi:hypothetical protein